MTAYRWQLEARPTPEDVRFLNERLYDYNVEQTGRDDGQWLAVFLRDEQDRIVAGLSGWTWAGWLKITELWISSDERRRGRGQQMIEMAEAEARARGCTRAIVDTYSFQAPGFYQKFGYRIVATIDDKPPGHRHHTLVKDL
jgi:ribosomal protein S18 acetylase RimI-like enzyme